MFCYIVRFFSEPFSRINCCPFQRCLCFAQILHRISTNDLVLHNIQSNTQWYFILIDKKVDNSFEIPFMVLQASILLCKLSIMLYQKIWYLCLHASLILTFHKVFVCPTLFRGEHGMRKRNKTFHLIIAKCFL